MKTTLTEILTDTLESARRDGSLSLDHLPVIQLDVPKDPRFGDIATNLAMVMAGPLKQSPRKIASVLVEHIPESNGLIDRCEIAGPGFINFFLKDDYWLRTLREIQTLGEKYGRSDRGKGALVLLEFVSANPTGPLHIGHGRGAVVGDALARILDASGYKVTREFYINDAGRQLRVLGRSVWLRYRRLFDPAVLFPGEDVYPGEYVIEIAKGIREREGDRYLSLPEEEVIPRFADLAAKEILEGINEDLQKIGVRFDRFFSERSLHKMGKVRECMEVLEAKDLLFHEENGACVLRTSDLGDDKDRVLIKGNGDHTYFASDIAYHREKMERGFDRLINIWGADHHGYVARIKSAIEALGYDAKSLQVLLIQMVNLLRQGKPVRMGKRSGEFVTLSEVVEEVGADVARYFFLLRRYDSHLDFDLDLAKTESNENPVYYVQYAHARICSVFRQAEEKGFPLDRVAKAPLERLELPEERELIKLLGTFPDVVEGAADTMEPHRIPFYLQDLATRLHAYYFKHRVLSEDMEKSLARLCLIGAVRTVIHNALNLVGVSAPERM
ncbi:MAG: arginine--tRNA ligase [Deltaproteobacteria bacterium]|nr:arginine--tRNA ligase [Deltaproteobacteria bacterium]